MTDSLKLKYDIFNKVLNDEITVAYRISSDRPYKSKLPELDVFEIKSTTNSYLNRDDNMITFELCDISSHDNICKNIKNVEDTIIGELIKNKVKWFGANAPNGTTFEKMLKSCISYIGNRRYITLRHSLDDLLSVKKGFTLKCIIQATELIVYPKLCLVDFCITSCEILPNMEHSDFFVKEEEEEEEENNCIVMEDIQEITPVIPVTQEITPVIPIILEESIPVIQEEVSLNNPFIADVPIPMIEVPFDSIKTRRRYETNSMAECKTNDRWSPVLILGHHIEDNVLLYKVQHKSGTIESSVSEACLRSGPKKPRNNTIAEIEEKIEEAVSKSDIEAATKWSKVLKSLKMTV
jgi:hypothetical protein